MTGKEQARLLGLFFWIFTGLNVAVVGIIAIVYIAIFGLVFTQAPQRPSGPEPALMMTVLIVAFAFAFLFTILFSVPKLVAGYGLRHEKPWAKVWAIISCVMACMSFPLGTAMGVYGLVFLFGDEGKRYFAEIEARQLGVATPATLRVPEPNSWQ